jgi:hypothetical protein
MPDQLALYGTDLFGEPATPESRGILADNFIFPPFSVLNTRHGAWQGRKDAWKSMGIRGELGRDAATFNTNGTLRGNDGEMNNMSDTSIFDPVLCELAYRWFCPPSGQIVDPFAGGSVRGIVAALLGYQYWGSDLSARQIEANISQGVDIVPDNTPEWVCGDSLDTVTTAPDADFVFSCPPYGDLEVYSDDPRDISNMEYHTFVPTMKRIVARACARLKHDRFACFVVGDFRDKKGMYRNFVSDTISAFTEQGLYLYNEAILVTLGSLALRVTRQFDTSRKMGKSHQNVLVFVKGDPKKATQAIIGNDR